MHNTSSRRRFVAATSATLATAGFSYATAKAAEFELKSGTDIPVDHQINARMVEMWHAVEKESGGRIHVSHFAGSVLGNSVALLSQLRIGAVDFTLPVSAVLGSIVPAAEIGSLGFALNDENQAVQVMSTGPLATYIQNEISAKGIVPLGTIWNAGMLQLISNAHPIRTPAELQGMKIGTSPGKIGVDLFKALGASPVALSVLDAYTSLQTKLIDGLSRGLAGIEPQKYYEVAKYLNITNHTWAGVWPLLNADTWKKLPADLQGVLKRNNTKYALLLSRGIQAYELAAVDKLERRGMVAGQANHEAFLPLLRGYYKEWSDNFGPTEWGLLERSIGRRLV